MSIRLGKSDPTLPPGNYQLVMHGLPGRGKTVVGLKGRDDQTGEWWRTGICPDPNNPSDSLPVLVPYSVPFTHVVCADELVEEFVGEANKPVRIGELA